MAGRDRRWFNSGMRLLPLWEPLTDFLESDSSVTQPLIMADSRGIRG